MNDPRDDELTEDPILEATVDRVLAGHRGVIPAAVHDDFRRLLRFALATHPIAQEILRRLHDHRAEL